MRSGNHSKVYLILKCYHITITTTQHRLAGDQRYWCSFHAAVNTYCRRRQRHRYRFSSTCTLTQQSCPKQESSFVVDVLGSLINAVSACIKLRKKSGDKIYHLNISGSVVILLQMAPRAAGVSGMRNFTHWGTQALQCETSQGVSSIFI